MSPLGDGMRVFGQPGNPKRQQEAILLDGEVDSEDVQVGLGGHHPQCLWSVCVPV